MQLFRVKTACLKSTMQSTMKRVIAVAIMITITVSSVITVAAATCNAVVDYNGEKRTVQLFSDKTSEILSAANVEVGAKDLIVRSAEETPGGEIHILVKSAYQNNVHADGKVQTVTAHYGDTVAQVLARTDVTLGENDTVTPSLETKIAGSTDIRVIRKYSVSITADGKTTTAVVGGTVANALEESGITLGKDDVVSVKSGAPISEGMKIIVSRVTYNEVTATQDIAYQNKNENNSSLYKGQKKIKTPGKAGSQTVIRRLKLVDGKVSGSEVVSSKVVQHPVDQVTLVGTKKKPSGSAVVNGDGTIIDQNGKTISYKRCISGRCTGYTGGGTTSTGRPAAFGLVAVNPHIIPYGSRLYICSANGKTVYGYAIAADTGGGVMDGRIVADLYFDTYGQCRSFGIRNMNIYVL